MKRGFTLIEIVIVLALLGLLFAVIGNIAWQIYAIPSRGEAKLSSLADLRNTAHRITEDVNKAHFFWLAYPNYAVFAWIDYAPSPPQVHWITYYFKEGGLWREERINGKKISDHIIAHNIASKEDISFEVDFCKGLVKVRIKATADAIPEPISQEMTFWVQSQIRPFRNWVIFAGSTVPDKVIHWSGSKSVVGGDIHSNADVFIAGSDNIFKGILSANQGIFIRGTSNIIATQEMYAPIIYPFPFPPVPAFEPFTFSWVGDVDLDKIPEVWEDYPLRTKLKPGVYFTTGKMELGRDNVVGKVTFIADFIEIKGKDANLTPFRGETVLYGTGIKGVEIKKEGYFEGFILAPKGVADLSGDNLTIRGSIIANTVKVTGELPHIYPRCSQ